MTFVGKHEKLLEEERVKDWYEKLKRKSLTNSDVSLRNMGLFCERMNLTPSGILELAKKKKLRMKFREFVNKMESEGKAGSYIVKYKTMLNHWVDFNDINYTITEKVDFANKYRTVSHEKIPDKNQLNKLFQNTTPRGKVAISLLAFSGVRPETLGNYDGSDGLMLKDIEGLNTDKLEFTIVPARVTVRENLSKTREEYFTFIGPQGIEHIRDYLKLRKQQGETLTGESQLITFGINGKRKRDFLRTLFVTKEVRDSVVKSGFNFRPYVLRRYFISALEQAYRDDKITYEWRKFVSGHSGDIQATYINKKGELPPDTVEAIRKMYSDSLKYLETTPGDIQKDLREEIANILLSDEEKKGMDIQSMSNEELRNFVRQKYANDVKDHNEKTKLVKESEIMDYVEKGYKFKAQLQESHMVLMEKDL